jgi:hypothetical protein
MTLTRHFAIDIELLKVRSAQRPHRAIRGTHEV